MKEYLDFEDGEIIEEKDGDFFYEDRQDQNEQYNEVSIEEQTNDNYSNVIIDDEVDEKYLDMLNVSNKKFLDGSYTYRDDKIENDKKKEKKEKKSTKPKKEKKKKSIVPFINGLLSLLLKISRCIFCLCIIIFIYLLILYLSMVNEEKKIFITEEEQNLMEIEEAVEEAKEENNVQVLSTYASLKKDVKDFVNSLTEIVNGEIIIINNLKKGIITEQDAYKYFSKTLEKKQEMTRAVNAEVFPQELEPIQTLLKLITQSAENVSKTIMNDYLVGNTYDVMVSDMSSFYTKYLDNLLTLDEYLEYL